MKTPPTPPSEQVETPVRASPPQPQRRALLAGLLMAPVLGSLSGCVLLTAAPAPTPGRVGTAYLSLQVAWHDGQVVEYVTTDASDAEVARKLNANYAPRLAAALLPPGAPPGTRSAVDRVYTFPFREQANVFGSAPLPAGPDSTQRAYSPLWRMVVVRWNPPHAPRLLNSEEAVLNAEERGEVRLEMTSVVVNCPVVRATDGSRPAGVSTWRDG